MKAKLFRNVVAITSVVAGLTGTSSALATTVFETLGSAATATDQYTVTCPGSPSVFFNTNRLSGGLTALFPVGPPLTNMQIINTTPPPPECAVNIPAGSGGSCVGGLGAYTVLVDKTAAGAKNYRIDVFCRNIFGAALATPVVITQDQ